MAVAWFDSLSDGAHLAVVLADREARALGHALVDVEHLVLGLLEADADLAVALGPAGLTAEDYRRELARVRGADAPLGRSETMLTDAVRDVLRSACMASRRRGGEVTCRDLLGEALRREASDVWRILASVGVDTAVVLRVTGRTGATQRVAHPAGRTRGVAWLSRLPRRNGR